MADISAGISGPDFLNLPNADRRSFRALKNALTEVGEAVKTLPPDLCERHPGIDWRGWAGLRDVVSHEYFRLDMARLRLAILHELPSLLAAVRHELARPG